MCPTCHRLCDSCLASCGKHCEDPMNYRNFGQGAAWPLTCLSHEAYMALELVPSPWTAVPGFRLETIAWDLLHNVFLGTGRDLVASAIRVLIREGIYDHVGSSELDVILSAVHEEIRTTCKQNGFLYQECFPLV